MNLISKLIIILILGSSLAAQDAYIYGRVLEAGSKSPLIGANIIVEGTTRGTASDLDGHFRLIVSSGTTILTSSMMGYQTAYDTLLSKVEETHQVILYMTPITLESKHYVMVLGESSQDKMLNHLQQTNLSTTENLMANIEGVSMISRGSYAQDPSIRGLSADRMNITINGMKSFGACTDRMDPITAYVEAEALESIEVGKGALDVASGSTVGGNLNMTTIQPTYETFTSSAWKIKGGWDYSASERKVAFIWDRSGPVSAWKLNGAYRKASDYHAANAQAVDFTGFEKMNINFAYKKRLSQKSQFSVEVLSDDAYDIGYSGLPMDVSYARMRMLGLTVHSTGLHPNLLNTEWKVYANSVDHWMDDSQRDQLFMDMHMDMPGFTRTVGSYVDLMVAGRSTSLLKFRSDFYWSSSFAEMVMYPEASSPMQMVTWPGVERWNLGHFVEYQSRLSATVNTKFSLRYDVFNSKATDKVGIQELRIYYPDNKLDRLDHLVSANGQVSFNISPQLQSVLSLARGSRVPSVSEAYGYYLYIPEDGYLYLGNPDLPVEQSIQIEWQNSWTSSRGRVALNLYHYDFNNYIFSQLLSNESLGYAKGWKRYFNGGDAYISGLEISAFHQASSHVTWQGGMSYETSYLQDQHDHLPLIPPLELHGSFTFHKQYFWFQAEFRTSASQTQYSSLSGENATPAFYLVNLKGEVLLTPGINLNMGIKNLTNQLYYEHLDWGDIYRPGRSGFVTLTIDQGVMER